VDQLCQSPSGGTPACLVEADASAVARRAADWLAAATQAAIAARGRAVLALSGGHTPWATFARFACMDLDWSRVFITQVDERIAPIDDERRNLVALRRLFVEQGNLPASHLVALPVDAASRADLNALRAAAARHAAQLLADDLAIADVIQLGLGSDGHTASLLPGDPLLEEHGAWIGVSRELDGLRRMTLTLPAIDAARTRLWIVTGQNKRERLRELLDASTDSPAVRVTRRESTVVCDRASVA
jgi:6-phosphogluconolactonase